MKLIDIDALGIGRCNEDVFPDRAYAAGWNSVISIIGEAPALDIGKLYKEKMEKEHPYESISDPSVEEAKRRGEIRLSYCPCCLSEAKMRARHDAAGISVWVECEGCHIRTQSYYPETDNEETLLDNLEQCKRKAAEDRNRRMKRRKKKPGTENGKETVKSREKGRKK